MGACGKRYDARSYDADSIPWCAIYANMVLTKVGLQGTETLWALDSSNCGARLAGPAVAARTQCFAVVAITFAERSWSDKRLSRAPASAETWREK